MDALVNLAIFVVFIALGYGVGRRRERNHLAELQGFEQGLRDVGVCDLRRLPGLEQATCLGLVNGECVIATDYFKVIAGALRNLFGGEVRSLETLLDRSRRQAVVRMLEQARSLGANSVVNVRFETSTISGQQKNRTSGVSVLVYGTAVRF